MEKAMELIEQLANQLGVAVEYLWGTLVKQQYAEGITSLVWAVFGIAMMVIVANYAPKLTKKADEKYKRLYTDRTVNHIGGFNGNSWISSFEEDNWERRKEAIPTVAIVICVLIFILVACNIESGIQKLINPDYFALKEILDVISSTQ